MNWGVLGTLAFVACACAAEVPALPPPSEVVLGPPVAAAATASATATAQPSTALDNDVMMAPLSAMTMTPAWQASGTVANAGAVIASMAKDFRRCWTAELGGPNPPSEASGKLTMKVDAQGAVTSATASGYDLPSLASCLETVGARAKFGPPVGGSANVVAPLTFRSQ